MALNELVSSQIPGDLLILAVGSPRRGVATKVGKSEPIFPNPNAITAQSVGRFLAKGETGALKIVTLK